MIHLLFAYAPTPLSSTFLLVNAVIGAALPLLVSVVQRSHFKPGVRVAIGVASSVIAATVSAWAQNKLNWHDWGAALVTVFLMTKTTYLAVWKPSGIAPSIEVATTPKNQRGRKPYPRSAP